VHCIAATARTVTVLEYDLPQFREHKPGRNKKKQKSREHIDCSIDQHQGATANQLETDIEHSRNHDISHDEGGIDDEDNALNLIFDAHRFVEFGNFPPNHSQDNDNGQSEQDAESRRCGKLGTEMMSIHGIKCLTVCLLTSRRVNG